MMTNIYWPVYKNLESEIEKLMFSIHIDDSQLDVYSSKIVDLILRTSTEIESISKDLYQEYRGTKSRDKIKYDYDAIKLLESNLSLSNKKVIISNYNYHSNLKELFPFKKDEKRTGSEKTTFGWNNAYQNLKHNRVQSMTFGSIKYLFKAMSALYLLNLYFKKPVISLEKEDSEIPTNFGSSLFTVLIAVPTGTSEGIPIPNEIHKECVMIKKLTDDSAKFEQNHYDRVKEKIITIIWNKEYDRFLPPEAIKEYDDMEDISIDFYYKSIGKAKAKEITNKAREIITDQAIENAKYEIVINTYN